MVQKFVSGIGNSPTTMSFVERNDILVLQKDDGKVRLVTDGILRSEPVFDVNVASAQEQGLLGITTVGSTVYLYFTASDRDGGQPLGKQVYKYDWNGNMLVNPVLVMDLDEIQSYHVGGAMVTDLDDSVYLVVGDAGHFGKLQNKLSGEPDDTSVILRIAPEGSYYAIGIRNSFGLAVDPLTGRLWDTENGVNDFDEINLVQPGFNSGWDRIMGPANETLISSLPAYDGYSYSDPEFSWQSPVAPTGLTFMKSEALSQYNNSLFVGDCNKGNLYRFVLNESRDGFVFTDPRLSDKVANIDDSLDEIIFGTGFGCVTDLEVGPDGFLYITSFSHGSIYRMIPKAMAITTGPSTDLTLYAVVPVIAVSIGIAVYLKRRRRKESHFYTSSENA
jgi:glucose/arabinose dehydrogenase